MRDAMGWTGYGEIGVKEQWGDIYGKLWGSQNAGGVAAGIRW